MRISEDPTPSEAKRGSPNEEERWREARAELSAPLTPMGIRGGEPLHYTPPDADVYGPGAVSVALQDLDFPQSKAQLMERAGSWQVPLEPGRSVELGKALAELPDREYRSADEVARAVSRILPKYHRFNDSAANIPKSEFMRPHGLP